MGIIAADKTENKEFTPKEIREMLGVDNSQIQEMCKIADIKLKRNERGLTYFTQDDAATLQSVRFQKKEMTQLPVKRTYQGSNSITNSSVMKLVDTLKNIENNLTSKLTGILDEKLDGMDDVVMELIRVKTENETMRFKINELNKENYKLKKEINSFKRVPFGFYAKTSQENDIL